MLKHLLPLLPPHKIYTEALVEIKTSAYDQRLEDKPAPTRGVDRLQLCQPEPVYSIRSVLT